MSPRTSLSIPSLSPWCASPALTPHPHQCWILWGSFLDHFSIHFFSYYIMHFNDFNPYLYIHGLQIYTLFLCASFRILYPTSSKWHHLNSSPTTLTSTRTEFKLLSLLNHHLRRIALVLPPSSWSPQLKLQDHPWVLLFYPINIKQFKVLPATMAPRYFWRADSVLPLLHLPWVIGLRCHNCPHSYPHL